MSYKYNNNISKMSKTSIIINNKNVAVKGKLSSINENQSEEHVDSGISENYKNNLILVFVIVFTVVIVVTGTVLFTRYN
jgi:cytochrome b subunit of formate dehydrogenase